MEKISAEMSFSEAFISSPVKLPVAPQAEVPHPKVVSLNDLKIPKTRLSVGNTKPAIATQPMFQIRKSMIPTMATNLPATAKTVKTAVTTKVSSMIPRLSNNAKPSPAKEPKKIEVEIDLDKTLEKSQNVSTKTNNKSLGLRRESLQGKGLVSNFLRKSLGLDLHQRLMQKIQKPNANESLAENYLELSMDIEEDSEDTFSFLCDLTLTQNDDEEDEVLESIISKSQENSYMTQETFCFDPDQTLLNFSVLSEADTIDQSSEKLMNFTLPAIIYGIEKLHEQDETTYLKIEDIKHLNLRIQSLDQEMCDLRLLWGSFHFYIRFGEVVNPQTGDRSLSLATYSMAADTSRRQDCFNTLLCKVDRPKFIFNDISLGKIYRDEHFPLLLVAHEYLIADLHEQQEQLLAKYSNTSQLLDLIKELVQLGDQASKLYLELRLIYVDNFWFQYLGRDSQDDDRFCFTRKIGGFDGCHFLDVEFAFDFHLYPYQVIHPKIIIPDGYENDYSIERVFEPCFKMVKPGKDNYLTELIRVCDLIILAMQKEIEDDFEREVQRDEMCTLQKTRYST